MGWVGLHVRLFGWSFPVARFVTVRLLCFCECSFVARFAQPAVKFSVNSMVFSVKCTGLHADLTLYRWTEFVFRGGASAKFRWNKVLRSKSSPVTVNCSHLRHLSVLKAADSEHRLQALGLPYILRLAAHLGQQALEVCLLGVQNKMTRSNLNTRRQTEFHTHLGGYSDLQYAHLFFAVALRQSFFLMGNKFKFRILFDTKNVKFR